MRRCYLAAPVRPSAVRAAAPCMPQRASVRVPARVRVRVRLGEGKRETRWRSISWKIGSSRCITSRYDSPRGYLPRVPLPLVVATTELGGHC